MKKVVITGGSGLLGPAVIQEFVNHSYEVINLDSKKPDNPLCPTIITDLTNLGEVFSGLAGADAVVHLAAIPVAYSHPNEVTFVNNVLSTYNVLEAAAQLGIKKAAITSSESSYGLVFSKQGLAPQYVPLDEDHPQLPEDSYGLSKIANEETAKAIHRRTGMQVVSMRLGNVITPEKYENFPSFIHKPLERKSILWSYIDARDAGAAYRCAVEKDGLGAVELNIANDDSSMDMTGEELMKAAFPEVTDFREPLDNYRTLFSNKKAKQLLGWEPQYSWRNEIKKILE
ncbi:NAD-dependent epimerase/dehydratase family protein [Alteribacillus sp. HJP-4]|uniref:NAD-dependent epimerase/dehydratase family protein n=1 Tax=Alteribacillus sp. HJP-4 TaxID=2775394 RepID=UPI0035CD399A